uniref:C-type lectin domain-containing protein n=1 Tax=Chrysemys picta bellii TaxID=8478 RepID=A0A8C3H6L1_CHRPI
ISPCFIADNFSPLQQPPDVLEPVSEGFFPLIQVGWEKDALTPFYFSVSKANVTTPDSPAACCPENWIGYQGKCYLFSEDEANWTSSQHSCSSHGASLAWLDTLQEKDFLMRHKGYLDAWIGLRRELGQPWKWPNGSVFNDP